LGVTAPPAQPFQATHPRRSSRRPANLLTYPGGAEYL